MSAKADKKADFLFIGGRLALDFVNTEVIIDGQLVDLLDDHLALYAWAQAAGLPVSKPEAPEAADDAMRDLRRHARRLCQAHLDGQPADALDIQGLNAFLETPRVAPAIVLREEGYGRAEPNLDHRGILRAVADDVADLLCGDALTRLRGCDHEACVLLFVDRSRRGSRRWCSMKICGNRAKVAAHRKRLR